MEQKRFKFKEDIRFYADDSKTHELMRLKARQRFDPRARYDVTAADGTKIGEIQKVFGESLLRSTYLLFNADGDEIAKARERSLAVALIRRLIGFVPFIGGFTDWLPIPYHFNFVRGDDGARLARAHRLQAARHLHDRHERGPGPHDRPPHDPRDRGRHGRPAGPLMLRNATPADAARCAEIYLPHVRDGVASLEEDPPGTEEMAGRIDGITRTHPWLVAERDGEVAGYAYGAPHHTRAAYRWSTDVTVYVADEHQRKGVGRDLYEELFELLCAAGRSRWPAPA